MLLKKLSVLVCASFISCMSFAQTNTEQRETDKVIDTFLQCDNQFFEQLAKHQESINQYVDLATTPEQVTYIPVKAIQNLDENQVMLKKPLEYHGLKIIGYRNIYIPTSLYGYFLYWGFIFDNNEIEVKNALNNINWLPYNTNIYIANSQIYDHKLNPATWQDDPYAIDGVIPRIGTINKALYLEQIANNQSSVFCSIQGDIEKKELFVIRPDLKPIIEKQEAELQEKIKAYKEKMQKKKEKQEQEQEQQPQTHINPIETTSKDGDNI
jgi:gas vesicle protein